ncbi:MAG: hypothetical protein WAV76_09220, partial [Bacteroidota bacterium]
GIWSQITSPLLGPQPAGWYEGGFWALTQSPGDIQDGFFILTNQARRKYLDAEDPVLPINNLTITVPAGISINHAFDCLFLSGAP